MRGLYRRFAMPVTPVSVYDVQEKKLIGIFRSTVSCANYFLTHLMKPENRAGTVDQYIRSKSRCHKNFFNRAITFRWAKPCQEEILGQKDSIIFDDWYKK